MQSRKLGGGRILGNGRGLAPPDVGSGLLPPQPSSPFAASDTSTPSLGSRHAGASSSPPIPGPLPDVGQDLAASVSLGAPALRDSGQLFCPICEEEMVTLLQLNRHIDDVHQELPEIQQDKVKTWFDKQVYKARKFQPLSIINQKLRGLEVFEANEVEGPSRHTGGPSRPTGEMPLDPDDMISKKHWQRTTGHDVCTDPTCGKGLGPLNGSINCRSCGKLFCEVHTMYQMKLARSAVYEPVRGYWARVCETCYKSRPGYNDHSGAEADLTGSFVALRKKRVERQNLEIARLEKRLTRLTRLIADPAGDLPEEGKGAGAAGLLSPVASLSGQKNSKKAIEQAIVAWEDDTSVSRCPFCQQEFGSWSFRRHHCRICGRVVCADPQTGCSTEVGLNVQSHGRRTSRGHDDTLGTPLWAEAMEKTGDARDGYVEMSIRMCRDCRATLFSKRDFEAALAHKPADQRAYETLRQFEWGIRQMMPIFQRAYQALQPDNPTMETPPPTHAQIQEAAKIRKRLMDSFTKYNLAAVRIRDLKTDSPAQQRLQKAVYSAASSFLHANMVPLKHVPRMLRSKQTQRGPGTHREILAGLNSSGAHRSPLRHGEMVVDGDSASVAGSEVSTAVSALEGEEKELRERLVVLEEQRFLVQQMVDNARGSRRFEEVGALNRNVQELNEEIERLNRQVHGVEDRWSQLYGAGAAEAGLT